MFALIEYCFLSSSEILQLNDLNVQITIYSHSFSIIFTRSSSLQFIRIGTIPVHFHPFSLSCGWPHLFFLFRLQAGEAAILSHAFFNSHRSKQYWVHCKCERTKSKQLFLVRVHGIASHDPRDSSRTFVFKKQVSEDGEDPRWASNFCQSHTASSCGEFVLLELDVCEGPNTRRGKPRGGREHITPAAA